MSALFLILMMLLQAPDVSVHGIVLKADTDEPVARATVELRGVDDTESRVRVATTTADGRFAFKTLPPGQYRLTVARIGYVRVTYGESRPGGPGIPIIIPNASEVRVSLTPSAVIAGRIFDRQGQPVGNATVQAFRRSYLQGRQSLAEVQSTLTNDLGEYRLFFLTPGQYFVGATPGARSVGGGGGTDNLREFRAERQTTRREPVPTDMIDVPIYFPGTPDQLAAAPIDLRPGAEIRNVDIIAAPVRSNHVRGVITLTEPGQRLEETGTMRLSSATGTRFTSSPTPNFDLTRVTRGRYILSATVGTMNGRVPIEVFDQDLDNVVIPISNARDLPGRVVVDGASAENPGPDLKSLRILVRSEPNDGINPNSPTIAADGSFTLPALPSGTYRVSLNPSLSNGYLKSVQLGNSEGIHSGMTVQGRPGELLEIVVGAKPGLLQGRVLDEKNQPLPNAMTVLVPEPDLRTRTDLYKNVATAPTGEFKLEGLTPGNYKVFAWRQVESGAWLSSEFMREFEERGTPVVIREGSSEQLEIRAISN